MWLSIKMPCLFFYIVYFNYRNVNLNKNKKGLAVSRQGLFYFYEQRGWEKFFTVKQRGISLFVINFTTK
ncbi:hypothetical protein A499_18936 [Niallia nealsonii AAU1]|nr:hypothetical protein A499_18936 [Niallia nealsonii AAU1]